MTGDAQDPVVIPEDVRLAMQLEEIFMRLPSPLMESSTEIIGGVPQIVYKFPLDGTVSDALRGLDLSRILDGLIIGPSPYPWVMKEAFVAALLKAGVTDAESRVFVSNIPIRA